MSESARRATWGVILVLALAAVAVVLGRGYGSGYAVTGTGERGRRAIHGSTRVPSRFSKPARRPSRRAGRSTPPTT